MGFDGTISIGTILVVIGMLSGGLWFLWSRIDGAKKEASLRAEAAHALASTTKAELAEHKLHVAEKYVTKEGMSEQTDRIMKAINDVGTRVETRVDGLGARLDRFYETQPSSPRARRTGQ